LFDSRMNASSSSCSTLNSRTMRNSGAQARACLSAARVGPIRGR
jgi:hypothetical protein